MQKSKFQNFSLCLKFIILINLSISSHCSSDHERFLNFLTISTRNYTNWVLENNLDPSSINPIEYQLDINSYPNRVNLTLRMKDEQVWGFTESASYRPRAGLDMDGGTMYMQRLTWGRYILQGNYSANGTDYRGFPITAEGSWWWELGVNLIQIQETIRYTFTISPDGYVLISNPPDFYSLDVPLWGSNLRMDNFEYAAQDPLVFNAILVALYNKHVEWYTEHPTGTLFHRYFTELFKNTSYEEIIGYGNEPQSKSEELTEVLCELQ